MTTPYRMYWAKGSPESGQPWDALRDRGNFAFIPGVHPADFSAYQLVMPHLQITGVGHARDAAGVSQGTFVSVYPGTDDEVFKVRQQDRDGNPITGVTVLVQSPRPHGISVAVDGRLALLHYDGPTAVPDPGEVVTIARTPTLGTGSKYLPHPPA